MKLGLEVENSFKSDIKRVCRRGILGRDEIEGVVERLLHRVPLAAKHKDHKLTGTLRAFRECHIKPDLLLIYKISGKTLHLVRLGSHSELFKK